MPIIEVLHLNQKHIHLRFNFIKSHSSPQYFNHKVHQSIMRNFSIFNRFVE